MKKIRFRPERREPRIITKTILVLPALLSTGWLAYIEYRKRNPLISEEGLLLSPPVDTGMLIAALSIFTVGYIAFLLLIFSEEIKEFFFRHSKCVK